MEKPVAQQGERRETMRHITWALDPQSLELAGTRILTPTVWIRISTSSCALGQSAVSAVYQFLHPWGLIVMALCQLPKAAITNDYTLGGLKPQRFSYSSGDQQSKIQV